MNHAKDITGMKFGQLKVLRQAGTKDGRALWLCRCDCGKKKIAFGSDLRAGRISSCGTHKKVKDPYSRKRIYWVWHSMKNRCTNPNSHGYKSYGGRGIKVCKEWSESFTAFREWAYKTGYDETAEKGACTLDRIDVNGDYCPDNCRWVTMQDQQKNKRQRDLEYAEEMWSNKVLIHVYGDMSHCVFHLTSPLDYL